jgi:phosphocarrier protein HPr
LCIPLDSWTAAGKKSPIDACPVTSAINHERHPMILLNRQIDITGNRGLNLLAASRLVNLAGQYEADVRIACDGRKVNGRGVLELLTLCAGCGARLELEADGPEAEAALDALIGLIGRGFDEDH